MRLPNLDRMVGTLKRKRPHRPGPWVRKLGRGLSAAEVGALLRECWPCPGYVLAHESGTGGPDHPLHGWWEGPAGSFSRRPFLDAVWDLAVRREIRRRRPQSQD